MLIVAELTVESAARETVTMVVPFTPSATIGACGCIAEITRALEFGVAQDSSPPATLAKSFATSAEFV